MRMRRALYLLLALVLALSLVSCNDEERVEATYDEQGNLIREDYYYGREWDRYVIYTYDEAGRVKTKTTYTIEDVKMEMVEYAYHENNKVACENSWLYDENGNQSHHQILEYDVAGKKTYERYFDEQDRPLSSSQYSESEIAVLFEHWEYDENGNFTGRHVAEYYPDGIQVRYEKEVNARGQLVYERTLSENGIPLKNENNTYNEAGYQLSHSYEEYLNEEILLKSERWTRDDQGNEIEKRIVNYDHFGNVIFDEEYKNGKLVSRYVAEYYGPERPRRTESYRNDGIEEETRIEEFYDNGQQKSLSVYNQNGELTLQTTWDVAGNVTSSYHQGAGGGAATDPIPGD